MEPCFAETHHEWTGFHEQLNGINHSIFTLFIRLKRTDRMFTSIQTQSDELYLRQASNLLNGLNWLDSLKPYSHQSLKPFPHGSAHNYILLLKAVLLIVILLMTNLVLLCNMLKSIRILCISLCSSFALLCFFFFLNNLLWNPTCHSVHVIGTCHSVHVIRVSIWSCLFLEKTFEIFRVSTKDVHYTFIPYSRVPL